MKIKFDLKKYILVIIASIIIASVIYINKSILINSFEQFIFNMMKLKGSSSSAVVPVVISIIMTLIIVSVILLFPVVDLGKKFVVSFKNKKVQLYPIRNIKYIVLFYLLYLLLVFYM